MQKEACQALIDAHAVSSSAIEEAKLKNRFNHRSVLLNLFEESDLETQKSVTETLAKFYKIPLMNLDKINPSPALIRMCKPEQARQWHFLPIVENDSQVVVGMIDPTDLDNVDMLRRIFHKPIQPVFIYAHDFERGLYRFFRKGADKPVENAKLLDTIELKHVVGAGAGEADGQSEEAIASKFVRHILLRALTFEASDLLIEPMEHESLISLCIEGGTYRLFRLSLSHHSSIVTALRQLMKLGESNPGGSQRGSFTLRFREQSFRLLAHFQPSPSGEKVSVRIIDPQRSALTLEQLQLPASMRAMLEKSLDASSGLILVTGPSGSGKSSAISAFLRHVGSTGKRIISLEDLVTETIPGIKKAQFPAVGVAKSAILTSALKHNPDMVVIDEVSDAESLTIALQASNQCLMVISVPCEGVAEVISRFLRLGLDRKRLADTLHLVYTQRTVRKICPDCKTSTLIHPKTIQQLHIPSSFGFHTGGGCKACRQTGYRGTITVGELMPLTPELGEKLSTGASAEELYTDARIAGMMTMFESGLNKAIDGTTSLEEVLGALPMPQSFNFKASIHLGRIGHLNAAQVAAKQAVNFEQSESDVPLESLFDESEAPEEASAAKQAMEAKSAAGADVLEPAVAEAVPAAPKASDKLVVLLVDDSPVMLQYTSHILTSAGPFEVVTAGNVDDAWQKLQQQHFHLVITDHEMPGQTGQEFIERIRQQPSLNHTGTMLLTGNLKEASALAGGADGYVSKPTDPELLVARARSIAEIYKRMAVNAASKSTGQFIAVDGALHKHAHPSPSGAMQVDFTASDMERISSLQLDTQQFGTGSKEE